MASRFRYTFSSVRYFCTSQVNREFYLTLVELAEDLCESVNDYYNEHDIKMFLLILKKNIEDNVLEKGPTYIHVFLSDDHGCLHCHPVILMKDAVLFSCFHIAEQLSLHCSIAPYCLQVLYIAMGVVSWSG